MKQSAPQISRKKAKEGRELPGALKGPEATPDLPPRGAPSLFMRSACHARPLQGHYSPSYQGHHFGNELEQLGSAMLLSCEDGAALEVRCPQSILSQAPVSVATGQGAERSVLQVGLTQPRGLPGRIPSIRPTQKLRQLGPTSMVSEELPCGRKGDQAASGPLYICSR